MERVGMWKMPLRGPVVQNQQSSVIWMKPHKSFRGHSNNTWHFFGPILDPPPPCVIWSRCVVTIFLTPKRPKIDLKCLQKLWKKVIFLPKKISRDIFEPPPKCHVLFEWPLEAEQCRTCLHYGKIGKCKTFWVIKFCLGAKN